MRSERELSVWERRLTRVVIATFLAHAPFGHDASAELPPSVSVPATPPPSLHRISIALAPFETNETTAASLARGDTAFEASDYVLALKEYTAAQSLSPKSAAARTAVIRTKIAQAVPSLVFSAAKGNRAVATAAKDLEKLTRESGALAETSFELGRAYLLLGDAEGALAPLRAAVTGLPQEPEVQSAFGVALIAAGHASEGVAPLREAAAVDPMSSARHGNYATALMMVGRVKDAIVEYTRATELAPDDSGAQSDLGTALLSANETAKALPHLNRAVTLEPSRATFHSNLGYALQLDGHVDAAITEYRRAIELDSKLASAWINLGTALARTRSTRGEARAALLKAKALDPTDPRVKANLDELDALEAGVDAGTGAAARGHLP